MPTVWQNLDAHNLVKLHTEGGQSVKALAKQFGVQRCAIVKALNSVGCKQRGRSEAMYVRMANTTPEERSRLASASHDAVRGKPQSEEHRVKVALTRETQQLGISDLERGLADLLRSRGVAVSHQKAVGRYNLDLTIDGTSIAVEVFGGGWHAVGRHRARFPKRTEYLLNRGWSIIFVWKKRIGIDPACADKILALLQTPGFHPSTPGQYAMILGNGEFAPRCRSYGYDVPVVRRPHSSESATTDNASIG